MSDFAQQVFERAVRTFAQALAAFFVGNVTVLNVDWKQALTISATAALASVITSLSVATFSSTGSVSLVRPSATRLGPKHLAGSMRESVVCTSVADQDTVQTSISPESDGAETSVVHRSGP